MMLRIDASCKGLVSSLKRQTLKGFPNGLGSWGKNAHLKGRISLVRTIIPFIDSRVIITVIYAPFRCPCTGVSSSLPKIAFPSTPVTLSALVDHHNPSPSAPTPIIALISTCKPPTLSIKYPANKAQIQVHGIRISSSCMSSSLTSPPDHPSTSLRVTEPGSLPVPDLQFQINPAFQGPTIQLSELL